jgi:hypothetical protein
MKYLSVAAVVLAVTSAAFAQEHTFKPGQVVYVVALKSNGQPDFSTENNLKQEFEKQKTFKVANSLQSADFVFLMYVQYQNVELSDIGYEEIKGAAAYAVSRDVYTEHKTSLDGLRDNAQWQISQGAGVFPGRLPKKIVRKFHEDTLKKG